MNQQIDLDKIAVKKIEIDANRPTIIFLHDSLGCITLWRDFPEKIGEMTNCNILMYDRFGYGQSAEFLKETRDQNYLEDEADLLISLLDHWQLDQVYLFGHSDGSSISLIAAGKYPERIKEIAVVGAHVFVEPITLEGVNKAIELYKTTNLKQKLEKYHGNKTDALFRAWTETWTREDFQTWNIESFLKKIICPTLVIQGEFDEFGSMEQVNKIIGNVAGKSSVLVVPDAKHTSYKDNPELVAEKAAEFFNSIK